MGWVYLASAIAIEIGATLSLKAASSGDRRFYPVVVAGYVLSFGLLTLALAEGLPLGVAYGIWVATGVALTAIAARVLFKEPLTAIMSAGIVLIACGVVLIEVGASH
jgi:small multidrug resistance pump